MPHARPPAKVNLTLRVVGLREDGYHELSSVFLRIGLCDRLTVRAAAPGTAADTLNVQGLDGAAVSGNLVLKAFESLRAYTHLPLPALEATLDKQIPTAAGLGGGSSDAAAALRLAQAAWNVRVAPADELRLAESLGSDVPFFYLDMPAAHVSGRGETVTALSGLTGGVGVLLVTPAQRLSTAAVFAAYHRASEKVAGTQTAIESDTDAFVDGLSADDLPGWAARNRDANDLWPAAVSLASELGGLRDLLERRTGLPWLMSGSGSTLFALYPSAAEATDAGRALAAAELPVLADALIFAVDLVGPDPVWRYPWPSER